MDIATDTVTEIILRLRAVEVKEGATDPDSGSNPTDDGATDILVSGTDEATEAELRGLVAGLDVDERADLLALLYVGRGDMEPEEWEGAVRFARERDAAGEGGARALLAVPDAADFLAEGLERMGIAQDVGQG
ncbi:DUF3775 domain-containing protein [Methylobacterium sp. sgz302541]|uniref:DUF3775 domain-containing protein n=1 Tax=unclassified Methylobacterium TaxID=2615210 RepID=UPI003D351DA3